MSEISYIFAKTRLSMEIWRDIEGYEGLYQVSNEGRIKSLKRHHVRNDRILKQSKDKDKYKRVDLRKDNVSATKRVNRLVAKAFIPNPNNYPVVNHKDENKENNSVDNLEWCSISYNNDYGLRNGNFCKKVYQYTLGGELIAVYDKIAYAALAVNGYAANIKTACNGGFFDKIRNKWHTMSQYKGYKWSFNPL